jgi:hypothetical protein
MDSKILDYNFRLKFKNNCSSNREKLIRNLSQVFLLPEFHYSKAVLNRFFTKYPKVYLDIAIAEKTLLNFFRNGTAFILDQNQPFSGGGEIINGTVSNSDELYGDKNILLDINRNWSIFVQKIKSVFWEDEKNYSQFSTLNDVNFFQDRKPESIREKNFALMPKPHNKDNQKDLVAQFFNTAGILKYLDELITKLYKDFIYRENNSDNKVKRYGKQISDDLILCICVDFSYIEKELKLGYLELPKVEIEILSPKLNSCPKFKHYTTVQNKYPIARINIIYFMGAPFDSRIGHIGNSEIELKSELYFYSKIYNFYLLEYLAFIENELICIE